MGFGEKAGKWVGDLFTAEDNKKSIAASRDRQLRMASSLPYQPAYVSETAVPYEKTQSPLARAYLESVLTGNNPDTTFSGAPNAGYKKEVQQQSRDQMYGTAQQLQQASAAAAQSNPYVPKAPSHVVGGPEDQEKLFEGRYGKMADAGITSAGKTALEKGPGGFQLSDDASVDWAGGSDGGNWKYVKERQDAGDAVGAGMLVDLMSSNLKPDAFKKAYDQIVNRPNDKFKLKL